ncbi:response regulator [Lacticaseibacillus absianus]|uniref:response regulator n=1 Tax=Lacticaseibacillus absianus TaxID=2729623 RepID=UPI0015CCECFE
MAEILVVEDNPDIQALLHDVLTPTYTVVAATDGGQALSLFRARPADLIILDLMLPGVTGESVLATIRKRSTVPVLVLTAIQDKAHIVTVLNAGANDYLTKPFDVDELLARVQVQLRAAAVPTQLQVGELTLDQTTHAVSVAGQPIELTRKEFALLATLMAQPQQVFEKAALYERVWQEPYLDAENTFNVHLSQLRHKLNQYSQRPYITTVWGIGVRLM